LQNPPFKVIGIGAAFSPTLKANLYEGARLAIAFKATLVLIHVGEASNDKRQQLEEILTHFGNQLSYSIVFQPGKPVQSILEATKKHKIDLLILGAVQRENIVNYYIGSIARKITRKVSCSILLLINPSIERIPCNHIVVNGLKAKKTAQTVDTAFYFAHTLNTERISIVEEIRPQEIAVKVEDDKSLRQVSLQKEKLTRREDFRVKQLIDEVPAAYKENITITTQAIFGQRGYSIGHYAEVVRADLLVMNASKSGGFWDRVFPHDIEHILSELPTDVLIIQ